MRDLQDIHDPDIVDRLLKDTRLDQFPLRAKYEELQERLGVDFSAILYTMSYTATFNPEPAHMEIRRRQARLLRTRTEAALEAMPTIVADRMACLERPGRYDMITEVIEPVVDRFQSHIAGFDARLDPTTPFSFLISYSIGVAKRRRLEKNTRRLIEEACAELGGEEGDDLGDSLLLYLLASDSLIGMLGRSVHHYLVSDAETRAAMPLEPTRTGVPFVLRVAREDVETSNGTIPEGAVIRLRLDAGEGTDRRRCRLNFFGNGDRACIGRPLTLRLWQEILAKLQANAHDLRVVSYRIKEDDFVAVPENFIVEVRT